MGVGTYAKTLVLCDWPNNTVYWAAAAILLLNLLIKANFGGFRIWFWSRSSHFSFWRVKSCREVWNTFSKQVISAPLKTKAPPLFGLSLDLRLRRPAGSMAHAPKWNWMGLTSSLTGCARVSERTIMLNVGLHSRRKKKNRSASLITVVYLRPRTCSVGLREEKRLRRSLWLSDTDAASYPAQIRSTDQVNNVWLTRR